VTGQQYQQPVTATTNGLGQCTFVFPYPTAADRAVQGTVSVNSGASGVFVASDSSGTTWGTWSGSQPFGPITIQGNVQLTVTATGLLPNTQYVAQFIGVADITANVDASMPTALGATGLFGTDVMVQTEGLVIPAFPTAGPTFGLFPTSVFAGMRLNVHVNSGGPVSVFLQWFTSDGNDDMGSRTFVADVTGGPGSDVSIALPHLGDVFLISVSTLIGTPANITLTATHCTQPIGAWGGLDFYVFNASATNTQVILAPQFVYGGPAHLECLPSATIWNIQVQVENASGTWEDLVLRGSTAAFGGSVLPVDFIVPARPLRIVNGNGDGAPKNTFVSLAYDLSRVG